MPVLSYIQMGQSVIVVARVPARSIGGRGANAAAAEAPLHEI